MIFDDICTNREPETYLFEPNTVTMKLPKAHGVTLPNVLPKKVVSCRNVTLLQHNTIIVIVLFYSVVMLPRYV